MQDVMPFLKLDFDVFRLVLPCNSSLLGPEHRREMRT